MPEIDLFSTSQIFQCPTPDIGPQQHDPFSLHVRTLLPARRYHHRVAEPSVTDASFCRLSFTTVSANSRVSSSVFPAGTSTT